jgi:hypothetical protein
MNFKKIKFNILLCFLFISLFSFAFASDINALLSCSPNTAEVGDVVNLILEVSVPKGVGIDVEEDFELEQDLEILNKKEPYSYEKDGKKVFVYQFEIVSWSVGKKVIGPIKINASSGMSFNSSKAELNVNTVLDKDSKDIKDIKNNIEIRYPFYFWVILFIGILLLVLSILWLINSIKNNVLNKKNSERNKTPEEIAEEALAKISEIKLDSKENIKQYYTLLTEILKRYIEARYSVETMDQTTTELYKLLRDKDSLKMHASDIKAIMSKCDMVKFACFIPDSFEEDLNDTKNIYKNIKYEEKEEEIKKEDKK